MRCLVLANELKQLGFQIHFISCEVPGNLCAQLVQCGYPVHQLSYLQTLDLDNYDQSGSTELWQKDLDQTREILRRFEGQTQWIIVDNYKLDEKWESGIRSFVNKVMVIDDLADRKHDCDVLLDQNLFWNLEQRYAGLIPGHCQTLFGPKFALLRPEFSTARRTLKKRDGIIKSILVFYGGTDPTGETIKTLEVITVLKDQRFRDLIVDVVVGEGNLYRQQLHKMCDMISNTNFHCQINYMADLMSKADLALGAGGSVTWERCSLALPAIVTITAKNQLETSRYIASLGAIRCLGWHENVTGQKLAKALTELIDNPQEVLEMSQKAGSLIVGKFSEKGDPLIEIFLENE
jgi:UDP-2,4-diacetamido-2,4,6-trideoxy-beta-L-altropyranose hydrolase